MMKEKYLLNNGKEIPRIGFGTLMLPEDRVVDLVKNAIESGYRLIDTAVAYGNEQKIGTAIKEAGISREELFITTKVPPMIKSYDEVLRIIEQSLVHLQTDYIDLLLIHGPNPNPFVESENKYYKENLECWKAMEDAVGKGYVRSTGVSNFAPDDIRNILEHGTVKPVVNQIRVHIGDVPAETIEYCKKNNILIEAYSPLGSGRLSGNEEIQEIAKQYGVSVQQLAIRFDLQLGTLPLPRSTSKKHMISNADVDFVIREEDMAKLLSIELERVRAADKPE